MLAIALLTALVAAGAPPATLPPRPAQDTPLVCFGAEPFWILRLSPEALILEEPSPTVLGAPDVRTAFRRVTPEAPRNRKPEATRVYRTQDPDGAPVTIVVRRETCGDGMSDREYGYWVLLSTSVWAVEGCCDPPGRWPGRE
jgi:uncharacterized membrane protein